jgi:hypothetical protein
MAIVTQPYGKDQWRVYDRKPGKPKVYLGYVLAKQVIHPRKQMMYQAWTPKRQLAGQRNFLTAAVDLLSK